MQGMMARKMAPDPDQATEPTERGPEPQEPNEASSMKEQPATPQEEQAMSSFLNAAMAAIYDDKSHRQIMNTLKQGSRPDTALADTTSAIVLEIDRQAQGKVPETVILPGAIAVMAMLAETADAAGLFKVDDTMLASAAQQLTLSLMQEYGANPQDVQALIQQVGPDKLKQMIGQQKQLASNWAGEHGQGNAQPPAQAPAQASAAPPQAQQQPQQPPQLPQTG